MSIIFLLRHIHLIMFITSEKQISFIFLREKKNPMLEYQVSPALFFGPYIFI